MGAAAKPSTLKHVPCRALLALMGAGDAESAAVLTPYNGQVRLIRSILKSKAGDLYNKVMPLIPCCTC